MSPVFENLEITSFGKSFFKDLNPGKAPQYFLVIAINIALVYSCSNIRMYYWWWLFGAFTLLLGYIVYSAIRIRQQLEMKSIIGQLKTARILSVAIAVIALVTASVQTQLYWPAFFLVFTVAVVQSFFALRFDAQHRWVSNEKAIVINLPQLTLIGSSLLVSLTIAVSEYATCHEIGEKEKLFFGDTYSAYPSDTAPVKGEFEKNFSMPLKMQKYEDEVKLQYGNNVTFVEYESSYESGYYDTDTTSAQNAPLNFPAFTPTERDAEEYRSMLNAIKQKMSLQDDLIFSLKEMDKGGFTIPASIWPHMRAEKVRYGFAVIILLIAWVAVFSSMVYFARAVNKKLVNVPQSDDGAVK